MRTGILHSCIAWAAALAMVVLGAGLPRSAGLVLCIGCHGDEISVGGACETFEVDGCCADSVMTGGESPLADAGLPLNDCGCIDIPLTTDPTTPRDRAEGGRSGNLGWLAPVCTAVLSPGAVRPPMVRDLGGGPPGRLSPLERRTVLAL